MIATQTFWTDNDNKTPLGGWPTIKLHLSSWALSFCQISKYFPYITLTTDNFGYNILVDRLQLPYNSINTTLQNYQSLYPDLWVLKKIHSYARQTEPFVHIDSDAYLFDYLPKTLKTNPLLAQNYEFDHPYYTETLKKVLKFSFIPPYLLNLNHGHLSAVNVGIIGGFNVDFFKLFESETILFLSKNEQHLHSTDVAYFNIFLEQLLIKQFADYLELPFTYLIKDKIGYPYNYRLDRFTDLPYCCNYIHIMNYKQNSTVCEQMTQRLWLESPELYERVLTVCRELEATHHPISQPSIPQQIPFYRTDYLLALTQQQFPQTAPLRNKYINQFPEGLTKNVLNDVFQYESCRQAFIDSLPDETALKQHWQTYSQQTNSLLSLPVEEYTQKQIQQSPYCQRIDSEWNWAEVNEFALQTADRDLADNLQMEPSYYEVVLYIYLHQGLVREHLLDTLNMLILDAVEEPTSIASVISAVCDQVFVYQSEINQQELVDTIMSRIRHFLYHGVLEVVA